jgi:pimeloyl-ACP methyl ester carboxylesterase
MSLTVKKNAEIIVAPATTIDTLTLFDAARNRKIPIAMYRPMSKHPSVVLISHGYNNNEGTPYLGYSFFANILAANGYLVISIQHELPTDSLVPSIGIPQIVRRPFWERGADNILYVIKELKKLKPDVNTRHITLIGHSMGGDITAFFPQKYPGIVEKIITLDNRRMSLPRTIYPKVYSLRSSDQVADTGVLPTDAEQKKYGMKIIKLANTPHNNMCDYANETQRNEISDYLLTFLRER